MTDPYHDEPIHEGKHQQRPPQYYAVVYWRRDGVPWCSPFGPVCDTKRQAMEYAQSYTIPENLGPPDTLSVEHMLYENTGGGWHVDGSMEDAPFVVTDRGRDLARDAKAALLGLTARLTDTEHWPLRNPAISEHPQHVRPSGEYDATIPIMPEDTVYDEHGRPRPWILLDARGNPRTDVIYEEGVPYDLKGYRLGPDGQRVTTR